MGSLGPNLTKDQEKSGKELIAAIRDLKESDANAVVKAPRAANTIRPAVAAEHSLVFQPGNLPHYLRETPTALVYFAIDPSRMFVIGVYPIPH